MGSVETLSLNTVKSYRDPEVRLNDLEGVRDFDILYNSRPVPEIDSFQLEVVELLNHCVGILSNEI